MQVSSSTSTSSTPGLQASSGPQPSAEPRPGQDYVYREGDTLGSVAARAARNAGEPGRLLPWAAAIVRENGFHDDASGRNIPRPGDVIHIPESAPPLKVQSPPPGPTSTEAEAPSYYPTPQSADVARQQATVGNQQAQQLRWRVEGSAPEEIPAIQPTVSSLDQLRPSTPRHGR